MANVLIIGDSWGVPNYPPAHYGDFDRVHIGDPPEIHTEFLLRTLGHTVVNCSINAKGNLSSILKGIEHVQSNPVDWIVWFHTEMLRDSYLNGLNKTYYKISELVESISEIVYKKFQELKQISGARSIVIGGQAPVLDSFYKHTSADHVKRDWRGEILNREFPIVHSICTLDLLDSPYCTDSIEDKLRLLDQHKIILDAMSESSDFPDRCHPGQRPHAELCVWLGKIICSYS
jgi:hypothetical protein